MKILRDIMSKDVFGLEWCYKINESFNLTFFKKSYGQFCERLRVASFDKEKNGDRFPVDFLSLSGSM